jgi:glucokinase
MRKMDDVMTSGVQVLSGDIGGTKTRLAVFTVNGMLLETLAEEEYPSQQYASLATIIDAFLNQHDFEIDVAGFGIAGPVKNNSVDATNLPWHISATNIAERLNIKKVALINDLEANAWGIRSLQEKDFHLLNAGNPDRSGNAAIIAAGTGLGEAGLYYNGEDYCPFATEGGHTDFSPSSELEIELLRFLHERYKHVSWERVLSGPGLVTVHEFLCAYRNKEIPVDLQDAMRSGDAAAAISQAALKGRDEISLEALELFVHLYGVEAGNLALKTMATGGLYIGGGIAPKILDVLKDGTFMAAFIAKGRMQSLLEHMPVRVILNDRTALYGSAVCAILKHNPDLVWLHHS